jgi:hypothetical protein
MVGRRICGLSIVFVAAAAIAQEVPRPVLHPPSTEAERALAAVLGQGDNEAGSYDFLTDRDGGRKTHGAKFDGYFSPSLLAAIAAHERKLVKQNCGGVYVDGDVCGFDVSPLTCVQDMPADGYRFATERTQVNSAQVAVGWETYGAVIARYRLIKNPGRWVIDAISCPDGPRFNW